MTCRAGVICAAMMALVTADIQAQHHPLTHPDLWMDVNPTARSFGMGFTGLGTDGRTPNPGNPASIGVWALSGDVFTAHNWERNSQADRIDYDLKNSIYAAGVNHTLKNVGRPHRISVGLLYQSGRYHVGPSLEYSEHGLAWLVTRSMSVESYGVGIGLRLGIDIGFGVSKDVYRINGVYNLADEHVRFRIPDDGNDGRAGILASMQMLRTLHDWGVLETVPTMGDVHADVTVSYGVTSQNASKCRGYSLAFTSSYRDRALAGFEYSRDYGCSPDNDGWEIGLLDVFMIRRGVGRAKPPIGTFSDTRQIPTTTPDWSTEGYAIDLGTAQRWVRFALDIETSTTVSWVLDRIELRYETASFRHPDSAPPGLGDISIRQWTIGLANVGGF